MLGNFAGADLMLRDCLGDVLLRPPPLVHFHFRASLNFSCTTGFTIQVGKSVNLRPGTRLTQPNVSSVEDLSMSRRSRPRILGRRSDVTIGDVFEFVRQIYPATAVSDRGHSRARTCYDRT